MSSSAIASPSLVISLFGPMQVRVHGHPLPAMRSRKVLWLLALLTLHHDRPVEREWLAGTLWPEVDQSQAFANLRPTLSDLRKALGTHSARLQSPDRRTLFLQLNDADVEVDLFSFDAAIKRGELSDLERAVALYGGSLLANCHEEWVLPERAHREQNCLSALLALGEAALKAGKPEAAIGYYQRAAALEPWSDAARHGWMEALAQSGDSNAAIQVYRKYVDLLRSDPSAVPDEQTSALYQRLRREARRRAVAPAVEAKAATAEPIITGYLPHPLTDLVGREEERLEVADRLRRSRLVTLTGPGGIGKTRLALEVAGEAAPEYPDGVWLVALEAITSATMTPQQVASVLGVKAAQGRTLVQCLMDHLRRKRLLLVLDNCEHLLEASAQLAASLLQECPAVRILATSRETLGITGETIWAVPALTTPDPVHLPQAHTTLKRVLMGYESVQLFVERAQALHKSFALTGENAPAVAQICFQLEGIPLAIELAAARVKALTVEQVAMRLNDRLSLLTDGSRTATARQQTLRATLEWSYALLTEPEQRLLERLSIFAGGWSLEGAEAVCAGDGLERTRILDLLTSLIDRSLVIYEERDQKAAGRYRMLEMVRQYAAERMQTSGETVNVTGRHRDWCLELAQQTERHIAQGTQGGWMQHLEQEHDNLRAALDRCGQEAAERGLQIAAALIRFWYLGGHYSEGWKYLQQTLARGNPPEITPLRAKALNGAGAMAFHLGDYHTAQKLYMEGLQMRRALGDRHGAAESLNNLGNVAHQQGDYEAVRAAYQETLQIFTELGDRRNMAWSLYGLAMTTKTLGDYASAKALYTESLKISRELEDIRGIALALNGLGGTLAKLGDSPTARAMLEEGLQLSQELGDRSIINLSFIQLSDLLVQQGDYPAAQVLLEESLSISQQSGDRYAVAWVLNLLGKSASLQGDTAQSQVCYAESMGIFQELEDRASIASTLQYQAELSRLVGDRIRALELFRESLRIFHTLNHKEGSEDAVRMLAHLLAAQDEIPKALRLWSATEARRRSLNLPLSPADQKRYDRHIAEARLASGEEAFAAAWEAGGAMRWEQAIDNALAET